MVSQTLGKVKRLDYALKNLGDKGYKVIETKSDPQKYKRAKYRKY